IWLLFTFVITFCWPIWLRWLQQRRHFQQLAASYPGPRPWPFLGNTPLFVGFQPAEVFAFIADLAVKYGDTFALRMGSNLSLLLFSPRDTEAVLGSSQLLDKAEEYDFLRRWLNEGLLVSRGRKWHQRRRIITPAFHFRILEQYVEIFERQTRQLIKSLQAAGSSDGQQQIELGHVLHLCTLDIICGEFSAQ
ncbi:hypothetical protein KR093_006935, partial [Drosophila rubida]